jgi:hypothetical protein
MSVNYFTMVNSNNNNNNNNNMKVSDWYNYDDADDDYSEFRCKVAMTQYAYLNTLMNHVRASCVAAQIWYVMKIIKH